jgi:hypothetical protein
MRCFHGETMKLLVLTAAMLTTCVLVAQQPSDSPVGPLPHQAPPRANANQLPGQMPPDTHAPAPVPQGLTNAEAQQQMETKLADEPGLAGTSVSVTVDDQSVSLSGMVDSELQHDLAMRIARSYAGNRRIDDKIQVRDRV